MALCKLQVAGPIPMTPADAENGFRHPLSHALMRTHIGSLASQLARGAWHMNACDRTKYHMEAHDAIWQQGCKVRQTVEA